MKVLIVGGAGYVGGYLTDLLSEENEVLVYDSLLYEHMYLKEVDFQYGDIRDHENLIATIEDFEPDTIVWLAAIVGDGACQIDPLLTNEVNYESVKWLCENYNGKIVFTSTCSVYGVNNDLITEEAEPNPLSTYASTKLKAEQYLLDNHDNSLVFRLGTLFGLSDTYSRIRLDLVSNVLTLKCVNGEPLSVFGGEQWRPLLHVKDVSTAIVHGLDNEISGLYNLHDDNYTIKELAETIVARVAPNTGIINYVDMPFEDLRNYRVSSDKYRQTGWLPSYNLETGIDSLATILQSNRVKDTSNNLYSNVAFLKNQKD